MKSKYFLLAVICAGLAFASCEKDDPKPNGNGEYEEEGDFSLKLSTIITPYIDAETSNEVLALQWSQDEELGALGMTKSSPYGFLDGSNVLMEMANLYSESGQAVFYNGELTRRNYLFYYPYQPSFVSERGIGFTVSLPAAQSQSGQTTDHIKNMSVMLSDKHVRLTREENQEEAVLKSAFAMVSFPIKLAYEPTSGPLTISRLFINGGNDDVKSFTTKYKWSYDIDAEEYKSFPSSVDEDNVSAMYLDLGGDNQLSVTTEYMAYMLLPEMYTGSLVVNLNSNYGVFQFPLDNIELERGMAYTFNLEVDEDKAIKTQKISSISEWDNAVSVANGYGFADFELMNDITIDQSTVLPSTTMMFSGTGKLIIDFQQLQGDAIVIDRYNNDPAYNEFTFPYDITVSGTSIQVNNGIVNAPNLVLSSGGKLSGTGRFNVAGDFATQGSSEVGAGISVRCNKFTNSGTLNNAGNVYFVDESGSSVGNLQHTAYPPVSISTAQIPNSSFEEWYRDYSSFLGAVTKDIYYISSQADYSNKDKRFWDSGNPGTGMTLAFKKSPTTPETSHIVASEGSTALRMISDYYTSTFANRFTAGNVYLGDFGGLVTSPSAGVTMTFGKPYTQRPVAMTGWFDYTPSKVNYISNQKQNPALDYNDTFDIYIALSTTAYAVNTTNESTYPNLEEDDNIIAYGRISLNASTGGYQQFRINLHYKDKETRPAYVLIASTPSKNGAQFSGGTGSVAYLDGLKLEF